MSQTDLAKKVGKSQAFVNKLEHGAPVPLDKVGVWSRALNLRDPDRAEFENLVLAAQSSELAGTLTNLRSRVDDLQEDLGHVRHLIGPFSDKDRQKAESEFLVIWSKLSDDERVTVVLQIKRANTRLGNKLPIKDRALRDALGVHYLDTQN